MNMDLILGVGIGIFIFYSYRFLFYRKKEESNNPNQAYKGRLEKWFELQLQAYERIILLLERISVKNLIKRIPHNSFNNLKECQLNLINIVQSEYEHNITKQIYFSKNSWEMVESYKNEIVSIISSLPIDSLHSNELSEFCELLLKSSLGATIKSKKAINHLKLELKKQIQLMDK